MFNGSALNDLLARVASKTLDEELVPVDRVLQRWAVGATESLAHPLAWDDRPSSRPSPLSPDDHVSVERLILKKTQRQQKFIRLWYLDYSAMPVKCRLLGLQERAIYVEWRAVLWNLKPSLESIGVVTNNVD